MWSTLVQEYSSYLINVNFLLLPFKSSIILAGTEATAEWKLRSCAFSPDLIQYAIGLNHGPLLTHLLNSVLTEPNQLQF